jgi:hypothetical protein
MAIVRAGLHRNWTAKRLITELSENVRDDGSTETRQREALSDFLTQGKQSAVLIETRLALGWVGRELLRSGALKALREGCRSDSKLHLGTMYGIRSQQFLLARQDQDFLRTSRTHGFLSEATHLLATAFSLGWISLGGRYGEWILSGAVKGYYTTSRAIYRNCFAWFALRLLAAWRGIEVARWPEHPFPAPEYDAVLAHWRDPDPAELGQILLAVCDRHTHECFKWSDKPDKHGDFVNDVYYGWPIEVHMVFRLREDLELPIPEIDHPLMKTPLGIYLPPAPMVSDELLDKITAMAIEQYPQIAEKL